ncbi:MAG: serine protease AprX [Cryptosporangiaceae bacterium]|nr:serine protease AprX [Cryptosporangiaceae bacterium]
MRKILTAVVAAPVIALFTLGAPAHAATRTAVTGGGVGWSDSAVGTTLANAMFQSNGDIMRNDGWTGKGIGIAMIDTGVAAVPGLTGGNVVNGPDLSFESQDPAKRYSDGNGHGTHLAGIMVGKPAGDFGGGIAIGAKLTSIKVGAANGAVDVSQVIAAVDWVIEHRNDDAANKIRILELSYGTDGVQPSTLDPLAHAVENAWRAGIVVVAAAGNTGGNTALLNPASDPYVLSVGAVDTVGTASARDDVVTSFTNRGGARRVDIVVPGRTILSLRDPGSYIDTNFPSARVGTSVFKGSGTSQATAVAAGNIALLLQKRPTWTPDQVKAAILSTGVAVKQTSSQDAGLKYMDIFMASVATATATRQSWPASTGKGTLEGARGTVHVSDGGISLTGENSVWGPLSTPAWAAASSAGTAWTGGSWLGNDLTGTGYTAVAGGITSWTGRAWSGRAWSGRAWSGASWSAAAWLGASWS